MRKYKKIFLAAPFFAMVLLTAALLLSCDFFLDFFDTKKIPKEDYPPGFDTLEPDTFYAQHLITGKYYKVTAEQLADGDKCVIWAEIGSGITTKQAEEIADKYDKVIRPRIVDAFSMKQFYNSTAKQSFADILDYANWLARKPDETDETDETDRKLTILLLDIKDNYNSETNRSYVAGYFFPGDFYPEGKIPKYEHFSNGKDMIYIDTFPGLNQKNLEQAYSTFAHELQHLINYATTLQMGKPRMDTWIDEGLSSQAEHIYLSDHPRDRCDWFQKDENKTLAKGNNFFVWGNHSEQAVLDDYATVYMFFRWLRLQAGNDSIFRDIENSSDYDHNIIVNLAKAKKINPDWDTWEWEDLLRGWMAANYFPANNTYGYKGDLYLQNIANNRQKLASGASISLYPGEGVYSKINNNSFTPSAAIVAGINIRHVGMNGSLFSHDSPYTGNVLLTFNANTNTTALRETGHLTGIAPPPSSSRTITANVPEGNSGPYVIDARDVLGRERDRELPFFSGPLIQKAEK